MHDDLGRPVPLLHFSIVKGVEVLVSSGLHGFTLFGWLNCLDLHAPRLSNANVIHGKVNTLCTVRASLASSSAFTDSVSCFSQLLMLDTPIRHSVCVCVYICIFFFSVALYSVKVSRHIV